MAKSPHRTLDLPATVTRLGYVDSIEEIYDGRTILITPTFLAGGVKTKVLEGFAHGAPVVGNKLTFEAMPMIGYPLQIDDEAELVAFVGALDSHRARADAGVAFALDYIANNHSAERFAKQWLAALGVG